MKHFTTQLCAASMVMLATTSLVAQAQTTTPPVNAPVVEYDTTVPPTGTPIVVARAQITGLSGPVVTVIHPEGRRQVYDPIILADQTQIWLGKLLVASKNLRLKQYVKITGFKDGDIITADRIDIITGSTKVPPKKVVPKVKPKVLPKPKPKPTT